MWAVSQASPLRRITVQGDLNLYEDVASGTAYSSGGWMSDSYVQGIVKSGSQQQWANRNNHVEKWANEFGSWNNVMIGVENAPKSHCGKDWATGTNPPYTTASATPVSAEKPYVAMNMTDPTKFDLVVPATEFNTQG